MASSPPRVQGFPRSPFRSVTATPLTRSVTPPLVPYGQRQVTTPSKWSLWPDVAPRRVFDAFLFCDELDLLEARLIELNSAVWRHVLVEAPVTFQGNAKPLFFAENRERFAPWKDKIVHVVADLDGHQGHWAREHASREAIWQGLDGLRGDDIFMLSDVDEIPRADACQAAPGHTITVRSHAVAVNLLDPHWWAGPVATIGHPPGTMQEFREQRSSP